MNLEFRKFLRGVCFLGCWMTAVCVPALPAQASRATQTEMVLEGDVRGAANRSYVKVPFQVPAGTERVTISYAHTGREQKTAIDLGLMDPAHLRCWSGGNKSTLTVGRMDATPSCLPGAIPAGKWNVLLGIPNIRPASTSHYTLHIFLSRTGAVADEPALLRAPLRIGPAWYRGDLHLHTAHSDGQCPSQSGKMIPCPVYFTADAAARRGLDFIAITDHNTTSQYNAMRELQPYFDKLLLIPGREITTFAGHINLLGTTDFVDFRLDGRTVPDVNALLRSLRLAGGIASINHPLAPGGEICLGCRWTPVVKVQMDLLTAMEAINGGNELSGIIDTPSWDEQLNRGCRLTGIGGSDNHRPLMAPGVAGSIGSPTTVVYATELSTPAILDGIRAGHVFIDVAGTGDRLLEMTAKTAQQIAQAGDALAAKQNETVAFAVHVLHARGGILRWIQDGQTMPVAEAEPITAEDQTLSWNWPGDGRRHWFRAEVRGADGKLWLLGNPVYVNWPAEQCSH